MIGRVSGVIVLGFHLPDFLMDCIEAFLDALHEGNKLVLGCVFHCDGSTHTQKKSHEKIVPKGGVGFWNDYL